jgi:transcriptional regulator with XRE-family HTH domain
MRDNRAATGLTIQEAAAEAGVSAATFSRGARGHLPDVEHLLLFAQWVGVAHVQLPVNEAEIGESEQPKTVIHGANETTLESVALHLHADEYLIRRRVVQL